VDEGHRLKNAGCKLNAELKLYNTAHRLLLTGGEMLGQRQRAGMDIVAFDDSRG